MFRAGKTEALSDELQEAEKRVEFIRSVSVSAAKKLNTTTHETLAKEKRLVRIFNIFILSYMSINPEIIVMIKNCCN